MNLSLIITKFGIICPNVLTTLPSTVSAYRCGLTPASKTKLHSAFLTLKHLYHRIPYYAMARHRLIYVLTPFLTISHSVFWAFSFELLCQSILKIWDRWMNSNLTPRTFHGSIKMTKSLNYFMGSHSLNLLTTNSETFRSFQPTVTIPRPKDA